MSAKNKVFNFIQFSEINEGLEDELNGGSAPDAAASGAPAVPPATSPDPALPAPGADPNAADAGLPAEDADGPEPGADGGPQIVKVYTDSEEDIQELKDNGIELGGEEETEGGEGQEGIEGQETIPNDVLYIKIKTEDGEDVILPFKEESEENRVEVEGEENTFDTELVAVHNDFEFRVTAEIKVDPVTGEEEGKPEVEEGEPVEEQPAGEEGDDGGEGQEPEAPVEDESIAPAPNESFVFKQNIMSLSQFVNEGKREMENFKKAKAWEKELKAGKKKAAKKKK